MSKKKYLDDIGTAELVEKVKERVKKEFIGTSAEWNALSDDEKKTYDTFDFTDDNSGVGVVSDSVAEGDMNPVTSNAVYDAINPVLTDLTVDETETVYSSYTTETMGARMTRIGNMCWVHIDFMVTYTGETLDEGEGHIDFWSNGYTIPDFDDLDEWGAIPGFGYVSNSHRVFEITLNKNSTSPMPIPINQKTVAFRIRYSETEPIETDSVFRLRCIFCFAAAQ